MATPKAASRPAVDNEAPAAAGRHAPQPPRRRIRAVLFRLFTLAVAVVITVGAVEVGFRIAGYRSLAELYSHPSYGYLRADEALGWSYQPGATGVFDGPHPFPVAFRSEYRINSLGVRGPEVEPVAPGGLRVLVLGDSVASGLEVAENETYSAVTSVLLSARLGVPVQVINAGVRGYGTDQEWLFYRERLKGLHPDAVVHHTIDNDPGDNITMHQMRRIFGKPAFVLGADNTLRLIGRPVPYYPLCSEQWAIDGAAHRVDGVWARLTCWLQMHVVNHSAFFSFVTDRLQRNPALAVELAHIGSYDQALLRAADAPYAHRLTSAIISRMADEVRHDGARFVLMGNYADLQKLDMAAFEQQGIPLVRVESAFGPDSVVANDGHPNILGHRQIGELLAQQIEPLLREVLAAKAIR
jgi:lysophospholipase L1-like esterase